ncbi:hypothetical protein TNCV_2692891 [Trichonephila clavipes]|uniref:Uncharacterized protein n=1 Tax=Trichonephila clavipes TaxID=2585209 RepID=A0A8X7BAT6_TRICX|nr:hypothetical protein TNCV_2692891 [Trichonephila clavipes]
MILINWGNRGRLVVKVTDSWTACHEFEPLMTHCVEELMDIKFVWAQTSYRYMVYRRGASSGAILVT